jgi:DNA invertase Pin-like site-specific DNA recombinase
MDKNRTQLLLRVSSLGQCNDRQQTNLEKEAKKRGLAIVGVTKEKISGATKISEREGIQEILSKARRNEIDKVMITELSRLGRTREVLSVIEELSSFGVSLIIQDMGIETLDNEGKPSFVADILTSIINVMNKAERTTLIERVVSGIRAAQAKGTHCGRPKDSKESPEKFLKKHSRIVKDLKAGISTRRIARLNNCSPVTVSKVSAILKQMTLRNAA